MTGPSDCTACGHAAIAHNTGRCAVTGSSNPGAGDGWLSFPEGCGCTALVPDRDCTACGIRYYCGTSDHDRYTAGWATAGLADRLAEWLAAILPAIREYAHGVIVDAGEPETLFGSTYTPYTLAGPLIPPTLPGTIAEVF